MGIRRFEDLGIWKEGRQLVNLVYELTKGKAFSRDFVLVDQIRRAAVSITSNIAEGFDAQSSAEFVRFLAYARRSSSELKSQLYVALDQKYVNETEFQKAYVAAADISRMIFGFMNYLRQSKSR